MTLWRLYRDAARQEALALRLLPIGTRTAPLDLDAVLEDHRYLEQRRHRNECVRAWRAGR